MFLLVPKNKTDFLFLDEAYRKILEAYISNTLYLTEEFETFIQNPSNNDN